jgi:signal transduction histidine kinase
MVGLVQPARAEIDRLNVEAWEQIDRDPSVGRALAEKTYDAALTLTPPYLEGMAASLTSQVKASHAQGDNLEAVELGARARALHEQIGQPTVWWARTLHETGFALQRLGDMAAALEAFFQMLTLAEALQNTEVRGRALLRIGTAHLLQDQVDDALSYLDQAIAQFGQIQSLGGLASVYNNLTVFYVRKGLWEQALDVGYRALALFEQAGRLNGQARIHNNLGDIYFHRHDLEQAEHHIRAAIDFAVACGNTMTQLSALIDLARLEGAKGQPSAAIKRLTQLREQVEHSGDLHLQRSLLRELAQLHEAMGDFQQALACHKQLAAIAQQIYDEDRLQKIKTLEVVHKTHQARAEADLQKRLRDQDRQYFERLAAMKDDLMLTASHDLKNPIASIVLSLDLLRRRSDPSDTYLQRYLRQIENATDHMRYLITDLFELARLETGRALTLSPHDLVALAREVVRLFEPQAFSQGIDLRLVCEVDTLIAEIDPPSLRRALDNIIGNALKYTPAGGSIDVRITVERGQAVIRVQDSGLGIPADDLPHIFERFYRVQDKVHQAIEGTGLGLAIVKTVVDQHGGSVSAQSSEGAGTTITLRLPAPV